MSAPNIVNVATISGKTLGAVLTASSVDILTNAVGSGKVIKVNVLLIANVDGTNSADATVSFYDAATSTSYRLAYQILVPAKSSLDVLAKSIYLKEGDKIQGLSSVANKLEMVLSYEEIS